MPAPIPVVDPLADLTDLPVGGNVSLTCSGSTTLPGATYQWTLIEKPPLSTAALTNATTATPTLTNVDVRGTYIVFLKITDSGGSSHAYPYPVQATSAPYGFTTPLTTAFGVLRIAEETTGLFKPGRGEYGWFEKGLWPLIERVGSNEVNLDFYDRPTRTLTANALVHSPDTLAVNVNSLTVTDAESATVIDSADTDTIATSSNLVFYGTANVFLEGGAIYSDTLRSYTGGDVTVIDPLAADHIKTARVTGTGTDGALLVETVGVDADLTVDVGREFIVNANEVSVLGATGASITSDAGLLKVAALGATAALELSSEESVLLATLGTAALQVQSSAALTVQAGTTASMSTLNGTLSLTAAGTGADITLTSDDDITLNAADDISLSTSGATGSITLSALGTDGDITLSASDDITLTTNGTNGDIAISATGTDGDITLTASGITGNINLSAGSDIGVTATGGSKSVTLTASGTGGTVVLAPALHTTSTRPVFAPGLIQSSAVDEKHTDQFSGNVFTSPPVFGRYVDGSELTADMVLAVYDSKAAPVEVRVKRNSTVLATFEMPTPLSSGWRVVRIKCSTRFGPDQISSNFVEYQYSDVMSTGGSSTSDTRGVAYHVLSESPRPSSITFNVEIVDAVDELRAQMTCTLANQHTQDVL